MACALWNEEARSGAALRRKAIDACWTGDGSPHGLPAPIIIAHVWNEDAWRRAMLMAGKREPWQARTQLEKNAKPKQCILSFPRHQRRLLTTSYIIPSAHVFCVSVPSAEHEVEIETVKEGTEGCCATNGDAESRHGLKPLALY